MLKQIFVYLLVLSCILCKSQVSDHFTLSGTINIDTGRIELCPSANLDDYPPGFNFSPVEITAGQFAFRGSITHPVRIRLIARVNDQPQYISEGFYLDTGSQTIHCTEDLYRNTREIPDIHNETMKEYIKGFRGLGYAYLDTVSDFHIRQNLKLEYVENYARKFPDSHVALWEIASSLEWGYFKELDSAFSFLSSNLKNTHTGIHLEDDLVHLRQTAPGSKFPKLRTINLSGEDQPVSFNAPGVKYTLVDFWFSHCYACIGQFPEYVKMYDQFHQKGFEMIGVSIDQKAADITAWKNVIQAKSLSWPQYRTDENSFQNLRINFYPANFLLDNQGIIVGKDLDPPELAAFLQKSLD